MQVTARGLAFIPGVAEKLYTEERNQLDPDEEKLKKLSQLIRARNELHFTAFCVSLIAPVFFDALSSYSNPPVKLETHMVTMMTGFWTFAGVMIIRSYISQVKNLAMDLEPYDIVLVD